MSRPRVGRPRHGEYPQRRYDNRRARRQSLPPEHTPAAVDEMKRPVPVRTAVVEARDMPVRIDEIGTVEPMATVAVNTRSAPKACR